MVKELLKVTKNYSFFSPFYFMFTDFLIPGYLLRNQVLTIDFNHKATILARGWKMTTIMFLLMLLKFGLSCKYYKEGSEQLDELLKNNSAKTQIQKPKKEGTMKNVSVVYPTISQNNVITHPTSLKK